jgi:hypothetical protein
LELKKPGGQWSLQLGIFLVSLTVKFKTYDFFHALGTNPVTNEVVFTKLNYIFKFKRISEEVAFHFHRGANVERTVKLLRVADIISAGRGMESDNEIEHESFSSKKASELVTQKFVA